MAGVSLSLHSVRFRRSFFMLFLAAAALTTVYVVIKASSSSDDSSGLQYYLINGVRENVRNVHSMGVEAVKASADAIAGLVGMSAGESEKQMKFILRVFKELGSADKSPFESWESFIDRVVQVGDKVEVSIQSFVDSQRTELKAEYAKLKQKSRGVPARIPIRKNGATIYIGAIACGNRNEQAITMMKSATLFSQDANLHFIVFSDADAMLKVATDLLKLRWMTNFAGWDFSFEMQQEWFPTNKDWKGMYAKCATQRLFFPSLLPHIDSLIYVDSDIVILSNLTDFWNHLPNQMKDKQLAGAAPNNEPKAWGWYNSGASKLPYYGTHGINAGVMLMNLTQMRAWNFQDRAVGTELVYRDKIGLADQDILNIMFHTYPELMHEFSCTYNFNWVHCGLEKGYTCYDQNHVHSCFCEAASSTGIHIIHGNSGTFNSDYLHFLKAIYNGFKSFDIVTDSPVKLIQSLRDDYMAKPQNHCYILTADMLYKNAEKYLHTLY